MYGQLLEESLGLIDATTAKKGITQSGLTKDDGPARISTNLTVAKQTQGATFGEKVNAGLKQQEAIILLN